MQKNCICPPAARMRRGGLTKLWRVMKLTVFFLMAALMHVCANSMAQRVTISGERMALKEVFNAIEQQTGYVVFYNQKMLANTKAVSLKLKDVSLDELLKVVFKDQPVEYLIRDKSIILSHKPGTENVLIRIFPATPVKGTVRAADGQGLAGASVRIKGSKKGTITDDEGRFNLEAETGDVLVVSFTGYMDAEVKVGTDGIADVKLQPKENDLNAVTVSGGYYKTTNYAKTGSIVKVSSKDIERQPVGSPLLALQGRVPGMEINPTTGTPGGAVKIRIRGQNSLRTKAISPDGSDGNLPLYVVDGIPVNSDAIKSLSSSLLREGFDPLATLNIENIESIEVLKDADATAMYGSRGANGVILITTKNRRSTEGFHVDVNAYHGIGAIAQRGDLLNREQYLEMRLEGMKNSGQEALDMYNDPVLGQIVYPDLQLWDTTRSANMQDELVGNSTNISDVQVRLSGGNGQTSFNLATGYRRETLMYPGDFGIYRYNADFGVNHRSKDNRFSFLFTTKYGINQHKIFNNSSFISGAISLTPVTPRLYQDDGTLNWEPNNLGIASFGNPLADLKVTHESKTDNLQLNSVIDYEVAPGLKISTNLGYAMMVMEDVMLGPISSQSPYFWWATGERREGGAARRSWIIEPQATYIKDFGLHRLNATVGLSFQQTDQSTKMTHGQGYTSDALLGSLAGAPILTSYASNSQYRYGSIFARIGYEYNNRYIVNLTGRRDGSSRFGPGRRFGDFGAVGAAWIFSNENFAKNALPFLSFGKLRGSYGITGADLIGEYNYLKRYQFIYGNYHGQAGLGPTSLFNPDYAWEATRKLEFALEAGFAKNRINLEAAWFSNRSSNQLVAYPLPALTGFPSVNANFNAVVENKGLELTLNTQNIETADFQWSSSFNISSYVNRLVSFPGIEESSYKQFYSVGKPLTIQWGYIWTGVDPQTGLYTFKDLNNDGAIDSYDQTFTKALQPDYYGGLNNTFRYKGIELSFLLQFSKRIDVVDAFGPPGGVSNQPAEMMNRWRKPGDITTVQKFGTSSDITAAYYNFVESDGTLRDISFVRFKTLSIGYTFPQQVLQHLHLRALKAFIQGQNLFTWSNINAWDPETLWSSPPVRMITAGIQIKL